MSEDLADRLARRAPDVPMVPLADLNRAQAEGEIERRRADNAEARLHDVGLRLGEASSLVRHLWHCVNPTGPASALRERVEVFLGREQEDGA